METKRQTGDLQKNVNTFLLMICVGLSSWVLVELNHLDSQMAAQEVSVSNVQDAVKSINEVMSVHSKTLQELNDRILRLEFQKQKQ